MSDISKWESKLPDEYLRCRDTTFGHDWVSSTVRRVAGGFVRVLTCTSCEATKEQQIDKDGYVVGSSGKYADGYLRPKGAGRTTRADNARMRLATLRPKRRK